MATTIKFVPVLTLAEQKSHLERMSYLAHKIKECKKRFKRLKEIYAPAIILENEKNLIARFKAEYARLFDLCENHGVCDDYLDLQARELGRLLGFVR